MSALKVNQIRNKLRELFERHLALADVPDKDPGREDKILTRCLAALAVMLQSGCTAQEAAESVWDGADDNGIDAAFFDPSESRVILVQSKWINRGAGEPEAQEINTFTKGVWDIVEQDDTIFHKRLEKRLQNIFTKIGVPGTSLQLVVVSTGASVLAKHGSDALAKCLAELNGDDPAAIASATVLGLSEVYSGLANDPSQATVALEATLHEWSYLATPIPAYFGMIDGLQLKNWWKVHGKRVVSANIRHSLGATEVNTEIRATAAAEPDKFWYFNNGITLTAEEAQKAPAGAASHAAGNFQFKGASIVNGAQTVSSLGSVDDDGQLAQVRVAVRVVLLGGAPADFGKRVTRTNNLQNRVEPRDFAAQDTEQVRLREEMALEGIEYQVVRSDESRPTPTSCDLIEVTTALACAAGDSSLAVQVKAGVGRFFLDLNKAPYRAIFNASMSGARAFNAVQLHRVIDTWIDARKKKLTKRSGPAWGALIHGNRVLAAATITSFGTGKLSQPIAAFTKQLDTAEVHELCEKVYGKMVTTLATDYPNKFLAVLFKNPTMSKQVYERALA